MNGVVTRHIFHDDTQILSRTAALAPSKLKSRVRFDFLGVAGGGEKKSLATPAWTQRERLVAVRVQAKA